MTIRESLSISTPFPAHGPTAIAPYSHDMSPVSEPKLKVLSLRAHPGMAMAHAQRLAHA